MKILEMKNVSKKIGKKKILQNINMEVNEGEIVGFIGPNGAGKTTTIKLIVGILTPNSGEILINNKLIKDKTSLVEATKNFSCMIENPSVYDYLTGYENLKQIVRGSKDLHDSDIDEVVELVNLSKSIKDKVATYSLGMKQRLAIAQALITKPRLLILDEPTNGLDPIGIIEIRKLLKNISQKNKTAVLISSHILGELEQLCDRVVFIHDGKIFKEEDNKNKEFSKIIIMPVNKKQCKKVLDQVKFINKISDYNEGFLLEMKSKNVPQLIFTLTAEKIEILEIYKHKETLEEKYMEVYSK
ncbi:MAG: ABC transporter ATP-binding protein [Clostridium sp.]|nr:ABC transporter ATP-binding protein [Clostridium sp.]